jgi:hypothetical protein
MLVCLCFVDAARALATIVRKPVFMTEGLVKEYYSKQGASEWRRLVNDSCYKLEFDTTVHFIRKHLPREKGLILGVGGGP